MCFKRFSCDQCNHVAKTKQNLNYHVQTRHSTVIYPCDQCEFKTSKMAELKKHKNAEHEGLREDVIKLT